MFSEKPNFFYKVTFDEIVNEFYAPLYRFGYSLAKSEDGAGDLTQQTFYIYAEKGDQLRDKSKVKSWLFTTLYREFLRTKRKDDRMENTEDDVLERTAPATQPEVLRAVDGNTAVEALQEVDDVYRTPLMLFYLKNNSYKEIAEILAVPIGTVMSRISRGKNQLKAILAEPRAETA
ncbi:MAG: sigma-70 family RNA polymerase sigma factor [Opitutales bacterium]|nr:sigma-70 family RNA polymerase sigma factor [Opitutales bacterium]